ncbi:MULTISPECIES: HD domain-containing phosphohydrolase [unclassified Marinitoga]|uniref:HD domain-containing phosphohydrolase n=1 Tax=unclassified Marinitoga TaxID=2640159 RepID=UPI0015868755|nr:MULTISPECIES: HD domain-containing phosphohydrolase [unclassified Marinitoga]
MKTLERSFIKLVTIYYLIPFLLIALYLSINTYNKDISFKTTVIETKINNLKSVIELVLESKMTIIDNLAENIKEGASDIKTILNGTYIINSPDLRLIYFVDNKGNLTVAPQIEIPENFDFKKTKWYQTALKEGFSLTTSFEDPEKTKMVVTLSKAIYDDNNNFLGIISLDMTSEKMKKILQKFDLYKDENLYIINTTGDVIFNNVDKKLKFDIDFKTLPDDTKIINSNGKKMYYTNIKNRLFVIYVFDNVAIIKNALIKSVAYFIVFLSFVLIGSYFIQKHLKKNIVIPLESLSNTMQGFVKDINKKKFGGFRLPKTDIQEINDIIVSFRTLSSTIIATTTNMNLLNDQLKRIYKVTQDVNRFFFKFIDIIISLDKKDLTIEEFFESTLEILISQIKEAKYGSISILQGNKWKYIAAVGHDIEKLNELNLENSIDLHFEEKVNIIRYNEMFEYNKKILNEEEFKKLKEATKPFKEAMTYIGNLECCKLMISVEIPEEEKIRFSAESREIFTAFIVLSKIFIEQKFEIEKIEKIYFKFAQKLASIAEGHDDVTGKHIFRVGKISAFIAKKMGFDDKTVELFEKYAPLHDIGKIYVPHEILNKEGKLTDEEFEEMKKHTIYAKKLLDDDKQFKFALNIALYHHENCDGSGYPYGLKCEEIPIEAAIVKVVDVYDALRAKRPYKRAFSHKEVMKIITQGDNRTNPTDFHKEVLKVFIENEKEIEKLWDEINNSGGEEV